MKHLCKAHHSLLHLLLLTSMLTFSGCIEDNEKVTSQNNNDEEECTESGYPAPGSICEGEGLVLATAEECTDESLECQTITFNIACGNTASVLCKAAEECIPESIPPNSLCEGEGLEPATEEECSDMAVACITVNVDLGCDTVVSEFCREPEECNESGCPAPGSICEGEGLELATEEECADDSVVCQTITFDIACGDTATVLCKEAEECNESGYPAPGSICEGEGLEIATEEECADDSVVCQTITFDIACGNTATVLCKEPEANCLAYPSCPEGLMEYDSPCRRGEDTCVEASMCGVTIACRVAYQCDEVPTCNDQDNEYFSIYACEEGEEGCYAIETCGQTDFCRPVELCEAEPSCQDGEIQSYDACLARESLDECRTETFCSSTVVCRPDN